MSNEQPPAIYVVSLGCAKNLVDTEVVCGGLAVGGYLLTDDPAEADVVLINTCSFIADARDEADAEIRAALDWKKQRPERRVVVGGCLPQRDVESARLAYPGVDLWLGLDDVPHVARRLQELSEDGPVAGRPYGDATYIYDHETPRIQLTPVNYAYVKIAEGCNHFCRFCAIPAIRGRYRSRPVESVIAEITGLLEQGVKEINLIAQDTTAYGVDREDEASLAALLRACDGLPGDHWIRVLYTHPRHFTDDVIEIMAASRKVVPYIDMPLQHISQKMLDAMGRRTPAADIRSLIGRIRDGIPNAVLRTTFIVGYPCEGDAEYAELRDFVEQTRFDRMGVFAFSPEEGTPAAEIREGLVPPEIAHARRDELMTIQQDTSLRKNRELIGKTVRTLVEGVTEEGSFQGRSVADAPDVDNRVSFNAAAHRDPVAEGFVDVKILEAGPYDLYGEQAGGD